MSETDDSKDVPVLEELPPEPRNAAPPGVLLGYERPLIEKETTSRSPAWASASIPAAVIYAGLLLFIEIFVASGGTHGSTSVIFIPLVVTAPFGIAALVIGVMGHYSPQGRRRAGPAMWIVASAPGVGTFINLATARWVSRYGIDFNILLCGVTVIVINAILILLLNRRILKATYVEMDAQRSSPIDGSQVVGESRRRDI